MVLSSREGNTSCCNGLMQEIGLLNYCFLKGKSAPVEKTEGFGSTGKCVLWQMKVNDQRPKLKLQVNGGEIEGLVDTRADLTIISPNLGIQDGHFRMFIQSVQELENDLK